MRVWRDIAITIAALMVCVFCTHATLLTMKVDSMIGEGITLATIVERIVGTDR